MLEISFGGALLAGLLSFLSPCILPMVPFYLSYMAGLSVKELREGGAVAPGAQRRLIVQALAFALGVTTIFVLLGMGATALGRVFLQWRDTLSWVAGGVLILFGLHFLGVLKIGLFYREARVQTESKPTTLLGAYVMGLAFGFGWTPCVGPALAAILMVASGMGELWRGGLLLLVYGLGMTLPFVVAAFFAGPFLGWVARHRALMGHVEKAMGVMLIVFGLLIATNSVNIIADWMIRNFDWSATLK
ncbi:cytochrome c biogenesis CcdA family protein [Pseudotabrizicola sp. L79]|uniref:cytochrome c biogenesis CcdA family protein n=1 Tax=Pseudotabrizicola sp. L79 TaxID=3118402 RepID=UPI002F93C3CD